MFKKIGLLEGTPIYESRFIKAGHAITLPQIGIIIYSGAFSEKLDLPLIHHEFGHILQFRKLGSYKFYTKIGLPSVWSAAKASIITTYYHQNHLVEQNANELAYAYFKQPKNWNFIRFPIK